jgi:peptidoglycan hydrolase CwlO-like protein
MVKTDWKGKASKCARECKQLKKRIKELTKSRDDWKGKSTHHKKRADKLESDLKKIKNRMSKLTDIQ